MRKLIQSSVLCFIVSVAVYGQAAPLVTFSVDDDPPVNTQCSAYGTLQVNKNNGNMWTCPITTSLWTNANHGTATNPGGAPNSIQVNNAGSSFGGVLNASGTKGYLTQTASGTATFQLAPIPTSDGGLGTSNLTGVAIGNGASPFIAVAASSQLMYLRSRANTTSRTYEFSTMPTYLASDYVFPAQTGPSLTASVQATVTLTPVPLGINATDLNHGVFINDTGTPANSEAVQIQAGGSAVSGASSGTIKFTPTKSHTAYTIITASGGMEEAAQVCATGGGGQVFVPQGIIQLSSAVLLESNCHLNGAGQGTLIKVADQSYSQTANWAQNDGIAGFWVVMGTKPVSGIHASDVSFTNFVLDLNGQNQTGIPTAPAGISIGGGSNLLRDLQVLNATNTVGSPPFGGPYFIPVQFLGVSNNDTADNVKVFNLPTGSGFGAGAFVDLGQWNSVINSAAFNVGSPGAFITSAPSVGSTWINNFYSPGSSTIVSGTQQFCCDSAVGCVFIGNKCNGNGTTGGIACFTTTTDAAIDTIGTTFADNTATNAQYGYLVNGAPALGAFSKNIKISGGSVINSGIGIRVQDNVNGLQIADVNFRGTLNADISTFSTVDQSIAHLTIVNNYITNQTGAGQINISQSGTAVHPLYDTIISGNQFNGGAIAVLVNNAAPLVRFNLTNNDFTNSTSSDFHWVGGTLNTMATTPTGNGAYCGNVTNSGSPTTNGCVSP